MPSFVIVWHLAYPWDNPRVMRRCGMRAAFTHMCVCVCLAATCGCLADAFMASDEMALTTLHPYSHATRVPTSRVCCCLGYAAAADMYSLGTLLWEMVTGQVRAREGLPMSVQPIGGPEGMHTGQPVSMHACTHPYRLWAGRAGCAWLPELPCTIP
jgi:hypothetical protein